MDEEREYRSLNLEDFFEGQYRMNAAIAALAWLESGEYSVDALDAIIQGVSATDDEIELSAEEEQVYSETFNSVADFLILCGASRDAVKALFEDPSDDRAQRLAAHINQSPAFLEKSNDDLINTFVAGNNASGAIEEALTKKIIDGKVKWVRKRTKRKRMSSKQKAALRKARKRGNTSAARRKRAKSLKIRKNLGMA